MDQDDPTNIPVGMAAICRNTDFTQTSADTRAGINLTMQGINKSPISGLMGLTYTPVTATATDVFLQRPVIFDLEGALQFEAPVGSGAMSPVPTGVFTPPTGAHMIGAQAGNKAWLAFSNLKTPTSAMGVLDVKTLALDPYGMKPVGWAWLPGQSVMVGEMATPSAKGGNGHTYRCVTAGVTGGAEPAWPTGENAAVADGTAEWQELTMVLANRLAAPPAPVLALVNGGGTFATGRDVYMALTLTNAQGETVTGPAAKITTTAAGQGVQATIPSLASFAGWMRNLAGTVGAPYAISGAKLYEADVVGGSREPSGASLALVGSYALGAAPVVVASATGVAPPGANTARITPGQLPNPTVEPVLSRSAGLGVFPAGRDVYVIQTYTNAAGETTPGPANSIIGTQTNDAIQVDVAGLAQYPQIAAVRIYEADVATGAVAPSFAEYAFVGSYQPGATPLITGSAAGGPPPTVNTTGPGGNIVADTAAGGANGTQGLRYAAQMFMNRNQTISGFTQNSVVSCLVDEDGWELAAFNVASGPANVAGRIVAFTVADGTSAGPFNWIGNSSTAAPTTNFIYPQTYISDGVAMSSTLILDNATSFGTFNFTDEYLLASNDATDRLRVVQPPTCVHVAYLPSVDRMALCGVPGYYSGTVVSLGGDYESFYGDTSPIPVSSTSGERAWGCIEYRDVIYLMRDRSGVVLSANASDPSTWASSERWGKVGPCGPRAFDACSDFIIFVHPSGIYRYADTLPAPVTNEIPNWWSKVNWAAAETIAVRIDEFTQTVRFLLPFGNSMVPNQELMISYKQGWEDPIHFSVLSGKETSMPMARRTSMNDVAAFVVDRIYRTLPPSSASAAPIGPSSLIPTEKSFFTSQLVYGSSGPDGGVHARTPGVFTDNSAGIDWQYETASAGNMMALSKIEGAVVNATGSGLITMSFLASRDMATDWSPSGRSKELRVRPLDLSPNQPGSLTRRVPSKLNEFWRVRFTNGKQPGVWASIKYMKVYTIPFADSREEGEAQA